MKAKQCNIYIHDLDVKQEARIRRILLMSGAQNATSVRFIQDLDIADVWVLTKDSAFLNYAKKRLSEGSLFKLWLFDGKHTWLVEKDAFIALTLTDIANFIDKKIKQGETVKKVNDKHIAKSIIPNIAKRIRNGMKAQQGQLCISLHPALFLFDFNNLQVKYNNAAYEMLWLNTNNNFSMSHMKIVEEASDKSVLSKSCSAFLAIWQMTHKLQDEKLANLLTDNTLLKLDTWPPFEQVKHQLDDYRIASLLQKKSLSAQQVSELLNIERNSVNMFFNAIYLSAAGNLEHSQASVVIQKPSKSSTLSGLWKKMRFAVGAS